MEEAATGEVTSSCYTHTHTHTHLCRYMQPVYTAESPTMHATGHPIHYSSLFTG